MRSKTGLPGNRCRLGSVTAHSQARNELATKQLEAVRSWFADEVLVESHRQQLLGSIGGDAKAGVTLPWLAEFAAKVTASLKTDNEYRQEIRRRTSRDSADLVRRVNLLLDAVHVALEPAKLALCIVFDNLEKTDLELVDGAVLKRAKEFRRLRTNTVLFLSPACEFSPLSQPASNFFDCIRVPVLPVRLLGDGPGHVRAEATRAIEDLLSRRLLLSAVFDDPPACIGALAQWSGGHIRDMLLIGRRAAENREPKQVRAEDIAEAGRWLGRRRTSALAPEDLARAVEIHRTKRILNTEQDRRMLMKSCVLPYDGTEWWDIHPGVRDDELFGLAQDQAARTAQDEADLS